MTGVHPRDTAAEATSRYGSAQMAQWCADLITGRLPANHPDHPALDAVAGTSSYLARIRAGQSPDYWVRIWAARTLLYLWDDTATSAVITGLADEQWRIREMCAKVCRLRELGQAAGELSELVADDVPRVRTAALRALAVVGEAEDADAVRAALEDPDRSVADAASTALEAMSVRLDRDLG